MDDVINRIILGNELLASFWSDSHGWAPVDAAELISKSRLDWQVELSKTLHLWDKDQLNDGELILAWANLGALIEGTLKLFLSVFFLDYKDDEEKFSDKKGNLVDPDGLPLEKLKVFFRKKDLFPTEHMKLIELVQQRRNVIHAFKNRTIGTKQEFDLSVSKYLKLMLNVSSQLPCPYEMVY